MSTRVTESIHRLLSSFRSLDSLLESSGVEHKHESLNVLKGYLVNRRNSELMECILFIRNCNNNVYTVDSFIEFYREFINVNSNKSLNLPSQVIQQAFDLYQQLTCTKVISNHQLFSLKIESIMKNIFNLIEYQIDIEILPQFRKSTEYKTYILEKVIELGSDNPQQPSGLSSSQRGSCHDLTAHLDDALSDSDQDQLDKSTTIEHMLKEGNMLEHLKAFQKKKLIHLYQIKDFTTQDLKDKIGIKKIGHLKRIVRLVSQHFNNKPNDLSLYWFGSFSFHILLLTFLIEKECIQSQLDSD